MKTLGKTLPAMRFLHYLKDNLFIRTVNKINYIIDQNTLTIFENADASIATYIEANYLDFELNIGSAPQQLLQDYSMMINDISLVFEKEAMTFTTSIEYIILSALSKEAALDALAYGIDRINEEIEDFNKHYLSEALAYLQEEYEFRLEKESKEIH